ncbi:MAG: hypothetical protein ACUVS3_11465 [Thermodesulfobacteriota bacterium]
MRIQAPGVGVGLMSTSMQGLGDYLLPILFQDQRAGFRDWRSAGP